MPRAALLVVAEPREGVATPLTRELLGVARRLAPELGGEIAAVLIASDAAAAITRAARVENLSTDELAASARNVGYPVVGLVAGLSRAAGVAPESASRGSSRDALR